MATAEQTVARKLSAEAIDALCQRREALKAELEAVNETLTGQVEAYGFTPAGAEKSKRVASECWQVTVSYGETTEIRDAQVQAIEKLCPVDLFSKLFRKVTQYKLHSGASMLLAGTLPAGSPANLRRLFQAAVVLKQKKPSLRIEPIGE